MDQHAALEAARQKHAEDAGPLFHQPWWLDAAGSGRCETVTVSWDGRLVGSLTFLRSRRFGFTRLRMPPYTRTLGPAITPPPSKACQRGANTRRIVAGLVEQLPRHDRFETTLDPASDPALPFAFDVAGFDVCQAFTFRVGPDEDMDAIWESLDKKTRNLIRSARRRNEVMAVSDFDRFERMSRQERDEGSTHDYTVLRRLYQDAARRGQAALHMAVQEDGQDAAALILVWDATTMYYWTSARNRALVSGASTLLLWDAIRFAKALGLTLDFDGYCSPTSARFLAGFGRPPLVRPVIGHTTTRYSLAELGRGLLRRARPEVGAS